MGGCFHCNPQSLKVCLPGHSCRAQVWGSVQSVWLQWLCGRSEAGIWQRLVFLRSCTSKRIINFCPLMLKWMTLGAFLCLQEAQRTSQINEKLTHLWGNSPFKSVNVMVAGLSCSMDIRRTSRDTTHRKCSLNNWEWDWLNSVCPLTESPYQRAVVLDRLSWGSSSMTDCHSNSQHCDVHPACTSRPWRH